MHGDEGHAQVGDARGCPLDRLVNIQKFQVEKHGFSPILSQTDDRRSFARKEFQADFHHTDRRMNAIKQRFRGRSRGHVQGKNESLFGLNPRSYVIPVHACIFSIDRL